MPVRSVVGVAATLLLLAGCFYSPVMHFGGKSETQSEQDRMHDLTPAPLPTEGEWPGELTTLTVRVLADDDYRAENLRWQQGFDDTLAYVNAVIGPMLGIRFTPAYGEWSHRAAGGTLTDGLDALHRADDGDGVFCVIGLTSALSLVSMDADQLGVADLPGRYMILRGFADRQERDVFEKIFREMEPEEREQLIEARRRHKLAAVFLHELAHNLGVPHEEGDTIMNPTYSHKWGEFSSSARARMVATVDQRLGRAPHREPAPPPVGTTPIEAAHGQSQSHPTLVIVVSATGAALIDGRPLPADELDAALRASYLQDPETDVVLQTAPSAPRTVIDKLVEHAHAVGLAHVVAH
jgi:hypothetical protein